jgi:hypothetical protein
MESVIHELAPLVAADDTEAQGDRHTRNKSQVVAKASRQPNRDGEKHGTNAQVQDDSIPMSILQVNQIWIWTIDDSMLP